MGRNLADVALWDQDTMILHHMEIVESSQQNEVGQLVSGRKRKVLNRKSGKKDYVLSISVMIW